MDAVVMSNARAALYDEIRHAIAAGMVDRLDDDVLADLAARYVAGEDLDALADGWVRNLKTAEPTVPTGKEDPA
jgi:hypothetical protein